MSPLTTHVAKVAMANPMADSAPDAYLENVHRFVQRESSPICRCHKSP
jgi:hypothetical protein